MSKSLLQLAREVSARRGDLILVSPSSAGLQTAIISTSLNQYLPQDISKFYVYAYGTATGTDAVDALNRGVERRSVAWTASSSTLSFPAPGFPTAVSTGVYEVRRTKERARVVEAINSALGQLGFYVTREFKDETLVGVQSQWRYTMPLSQNWRRVSDVEIQRSLTYSDYPYESARRLGLTWRAERTTDSSGTTLWQIQFSTQPPPGYVIRIWGEAYYPEMALETDVFTVEAEYERMVLEWLYDWAIYRLNAEQAESWATGDAAKAMQNREASLQKAKAAILEQAKPPKPGRINTPLSRPGVIENAAYLGAFTSGGIARPPFNPAL